MSLVAELAWKAQKAQIGAKEETPECVLFLDPVLGLLDVDFHAVAADNWKNLQASGTNSAAKIVVSASASAEQIKLAIDTVANKGGYATILVAVGKP